MSNHSESDRRSIRVLIKSQRLVQLRYATLLTKEEEEEGKGGNIS